MNLKNSSHLTPSQLTQVQHSVNLIGHSSATSLVRLCYLLCFSCQNDDVIDLLDRAHRGEISVGVYARGVNLNCENDDVHVASPSRTKRRIRAESRGEEDRKTLAFVMKTSSGCIIESLSRSLPVLPDGSPGVAVVRSVATVGSSKDTLSEKFSLLRFVVV